MSDAFEYASAELKGDVEVITVALRGSSRWIASRIVEHWVSEDIKEKLERICAMRNEPGGILSSLDGRDPAALETFLAAEVNRCEFLQTWQLDPLPAEAMKSIVEFDGLLDERLEQL